MSNDYFKAQGWFKNYALNSQDSRGMFQRLVKEDEEAFRLASAETDEIIKTINDKFGPGTLFPASELPEPENPYKDFEERNPAAEGGQMVKPSVDGSRPGYAGPKKDSSVIAKKIEEVNKGFKYYTYDALAKEIPGFNSGSNLQIYIKNNNLSKLESFPKKVEKAWISLFEDGDKSAKTVYKPLIKIREMVGGGQKNYGTGTSKRKRVRTDAISDALKESDLLVWDDIKPVISKLNSENFINSLDRKGIDYTIADVEYSAYNKAGMLRAPKTDAEHLMDYVIRHVNQSDSPVYSIYDSKTNKRITDLKNVDSYHDIYFKSESPFKDTTNYDMEYLKTKARKDPLFKEYFNLQDELFAMKKKEYWPDGSRIIDPKTGKGTTFGNWSGSLNKYGYGYTKSFERFPYDTDHKFGVGKHPFKNLAILPQRINIALGSVTQKNRGDLSKKIGADYFRNLSVDDLMMQEKDFGKKILIFDADGNHVGKKLETPYQNAKRIVKYYNDLDLSEAGKGPKPEFPLSDFQKPDQAVPIEKRLETYKKNKKIDYIGGQGGTTLSSGFNTDLLMKDPVIQKLVNSQAGKAVANGLRNAARSGAGAAGKVFGIADIVLGVLDLENNLSKGESFNVAAKNAVQAASINLWKVGDEAKIEEIKERFVAKGGDEKIFDQATALNKKDQEINDLIYAKKRHADKVATQYGENPDFGFNSTIEDKKEYYNILKKESNEEIAKAISERDDMLRSYKTNLQVNEAGAPINIGGSEFFGKPFRDIKRETIDRIEEENKFSYPMQKRQLVPTAGNIGNWLLNNVMTLNPQEKIKMQKYINEMDERELYKFNLERGMDPDNLVRFEDILRYKSQFPELMGVNTTKYINRADRKSEGGITGLRSKYEYKK